MAFYQIKKENNSYFLRGNKVTSKTIKLADPTYDLTFKSLFSPIDSNETNWKTRVISLLESLVIEGNIKDIILLNNNLIQLDIEENKKGEHISELRTDLAFQLEIERKNDYELIQIINIEMQLGHPSYFLERLINYGLLLKKKNRKEEKENKKNGIFNSVKILVLGFINYKGQTNLTSNSYFLSEFSSENNQFIKKVDDFMDIIIINLKEISQKLENNQKIYILGKELGDTAKNWLKLLCLRYWGIKDNEKYFKIPKFKIDKEIDSAITFLSKVPNKSLTMYYNAENDYSDSIEIAAEEKAKNIVEKKDEEFKKKIAQKDEEFKKKIAQKDEELKKKIAQKEDEQLKTFLAMFKRLPNLNLDELEKELSINFSEIDVNKVMLFWGDEDKDKLQLLEDYLGKKRKSFGDKY